MKVNLHTKAGREALDGVRSVKTSEGWVCIRLVSEEGEKRRIHMPADRVQRLEVIE